MTGLYLRYCNAPVAFGSWNFNGFPKKTKERNIRIPHIFLHNMLWVLFKKRVWSSKSSWVKVLIFFHFGVRYPGHINDDDWKFVWSKWCRNRGLSNDVMHVPLLVKIVHPLTSAILGHFTQLKIIFSSSFWTKCNDCWFWMSYMKLYGRHNYITFSSPYIITFSYLLYLYNKQIMLLTIGVYNPK